MAPHASSARPGAPPGLDSPNARDSRSDSTAPGVSSASTTWHGLRSASGRPMTPSLAHASVAPTMAKAPQPASTDISRPSKTSSAPPTRVSTSAVATRLLIRSFHKRRASSTVNRPRG